MACVFASFLDSFQDLRKIVPATRTDADSTSKCGKEEQRRWGDFA